MAWIEYENFAIVFRFHLLLVVMQPAFPGYESCHSSYSLPIACPNTISSRVSVRLRCEGKQFPQCWSVEVLCGMNTDVSICEETSFYRMVKVFICGSRSDSCCSRTLSDINWRGPDSSEMASSGASKSKFSLQSVLCSEDAKDSQDMSYLGIYQKL